LEGAHATRKVAAQDARGKIDVVVVAQEAIKPVELELMAFSFIQFCVCVIEKKKRKNTRIGLEITERHSHEIFQKKI
jgi:hypothetical protein